MPNMDEPWKPAEISQSQYCALKKVKVYVIYKKEKWNCSVMSDSLWPHGLQPARLLWPWNTLGKNTGVENHFLLQGIFPTQGSNLGLIHGRQILYHLSHKKNIHNIYIYIHTHTHMLYTYMYIVCILYMYILCIFATTRGGTSHRRGGSDIHWKDWCWNWSSNTLTTWCEELTNWKRPWCWERLKVGGEGDNRRWGGWMASLTQWAWVWVCSGR